MNSQIIKTTKGKLKSQFSIILVLLSCFFLNSCKQIVPCGTFAFTGNTFSTGLDMSLQFTFDPADCGKPACNTPKICFIQMVRTYDFEEGTFSYISEEHQARAIEYGWYVDRLTGKKWGYYGRNDDGSFAGNLTPGNNTTPSVLFDRPSRPGSSGIWWQAVSASVSIDAGTSGCNNNFLGYYYWSWFVNSDGSISNDNIIQLIARENLHTTMDAAVTAWNIQAPSISHNLFPAFNKLMY